jgi:hypothetical protein
MPHGIPWRRQARLSCCSLATLSSLIASGLQQLEDIGPVIAARDCLPMLLRANGHTASLVDAQPTFGRFLPRLGPLATERPISFLLLFHTIF